MMCFVLPVHDYNNADMKCMLYFSTSSRSNLAGCFDLYVCVCVICVCVCVCVVCSVWVLSARFCVVPVQRHNLQDLDVNVSPPGGKIPTQSSEVRRVGIECRSRWEPCR